jgi:3-hydroxyisobutyrate dehydrogenase-like beta-hydroxyacid dehydrogenase
MLGEDVMDQFALIGGLGVMLSPSAQHLQQATTMRVATVLDRGRASSARDAARQAWRDYGASLVTDYVSLLEGCAHVLVCAGKNGGDLAIIKNIVQHWQDRGQNEGVIIHCSTLTPAFVVAAFGYCQQFGYDYVNYPLTGGAKGAIQAKMLIMASGSESVFRAHESWLCCLGVPTYYGKEVALAAKIKLMSHAMVFSGLHGVSVASLLYQEVGLSSERSDQVAFFDTLNQGAGGTRQWDLVLRQALAHEDWQTGFRIDHACADLLYLLQWMIESKVPEAFCLPYFPVALLLIYCQIHFAEDNFATQAVIRLGDLKHRQVLDAWIDSLQEYKTSASCLGYCVGLLPDAYVLQIGLDISAANINQLEVES